MAAVLGIGGVSAGAALSGGAPAGGGAHRPSATLSSAAPRLRVTLSPPAPATSTPTPAPAAVPSRAPALPDFALTVVGRVSWVSVVGPHGRTLYAGLLRHGRTLSYPQRPLTVTLGDAGSVRLVLHHRVHAHAGRRGAVLRFTYR